MAESTTRIDPDPYGTSTTLRPTSPEIEDHLFNPIHFHDGHSFVRPVDYMGNDDTVIYWATMGRGTEALEQDVTEEELRRYLMSNNMMRPLTSVQMRRHEEAPIQVALTTVPEESANVNEYSGRYSVMPDEFVPWTPDFIRTHMPSVSEEDIPRILALKEENEERSWEAYEGLLDKDLARELSRETLPITNETKYYQKNTLADDLQFIETHMGRNPLLDDLLQSRKELWELQAPDTMRAYKEVKEKGNEFEEEITLDRRAFEEMPLPDRPFGENDTRRLTVPEMEEILFDTQDVLNDGFIRPIDYMGSDGSIVQAARVSYGDGTKTKRKDKGLINYLWRHRHTTPFEMVEAAFHKRLPGFSWRQDIRHRTVDKTGPMESYPLLGAGYVPNEDEIRFQSKSNRQGRGELMDADERKAILDGLREHHAFQDSVVENMEALGVPQRLAEAQRGVGFHTEACQTSDAKNWFHYLGLRADSHAQKEIRVYAQPTADVMQRLVPWSWEAYEKYSVGAQRLSAPEQEALRYAMDGRNLDEAMGEAGLLFEKDGEMKRGREAREFVSKLESMGIRDRFKS